MHDRTRVVFARAAARQPRGAGRRAEQGEACSDERDFSEEGFRVEHDGGRGEGRSVVALGTAMTLVEVVVKDRSTTESAIGRCTIVDKSAIGRG